MCFKTPEMPKAPPVPSAMAEDAKRRREMEMAASRQAQGRAATVVSSPLGDPNYGKNVTRVTLGGS